MAKKDNSLYTPGTKTKGGGTYTPGSKTAEKASSVQVDAVTMAAPQVTSPSQVPSHTATLTPSTSTPRGKDAQDRWDRVLTKSTQVSGSQIKKSTDRSGAGMNTATGSARDSRPEQSKQRLQQWWAGDAPTARETLARIVRTTRDDSTRQRELLGLFMQTRADKTSPFYDMYAGATNTNAIAGLSGILEGVGIEMPGVITSDFLTSLQQYADYEGHVGVSGAPLAPTKSSTPAQDLAYWLYQLQKDESTTQKAETEWADLQTWIAEQVEAGLADDEILAAINWGKYSTLRSMDEGRVTNVPVQLNRGVGYSEDALYGALWAARNNGGTGDLMLDAAMYTLGEGTMLSRAAEKPYNPRTDVTNAEAYSPYSMLPASYQAIAREWGVDEITEEVLAEHRDMLTDPNSPEAKLWQSMHSQLEVTDQARKELEALNAQIATWRKRGKTDEEIWKLVQKAISEDSTYKTLYKLEEGRVTGKPVNLTGTLDFSLPALRAEIFGEAMPWDREEYNPTAGKTGSSGSTDKSEQGSTPLTATSTADTAESAEKPAQASGLEVFRDYDAFLDSQPQRFTSIMAKELAEIMQGKSTKGMSQITLDWFDKYGWLLGGLTQTDVGHGMPERTYDSRVRRVVDYAGPLEWHKFEGTGIGSTALEALKVDQEGVRGGYLDLATQLDHAIEISRDMELAEAAGKTLDEYYLEDEARRAKFEEWEASAQSAKEAKEAADQAQFQEFVELRKADVLAKYRSEVLGEPRPDIDPDEQQMYDEDIAAIESQNMYAYAQADPFWQSLNEGVAAQLQVLLTEDDGETFDSPFYGTGMSAASLQLQEKINLGYVLQDKAMAGLVRDMQYARAAGYLGDPEKTPGSVGTLEDFYSDLGLVMPTAETLLRDASTWFASEYSATGKRFLDTGLSMGSLDLQQKILDTILAQGAIEGTVGANPEAAQFGGMQAPTEDENGEHPDVTAGYLWGKVLQSGWYGIVNGHEKTAKMFRDAFTEIGANLLGENPNSSIVRGLYSREEYRAAVEASIAGLPEAQRTAWEGRLASFTGDIYDFGYDISMEELKSRIADRQAAMEAAQATIMQYGSPAEQFKYNLSSNLVTNVGLMVESMTLGALFGVGALPEGAMKTGLGIATSSIVYGLPEAAELAEKLQTQYGMSATASLGFGLAQAVITGILESKINTQVPSLQRSSMTGKLAVQFLDDESVLKLGVFGAVASLKTRGLGATMQTLSTMAWTSAMGEAVQEFVETAESGTLELVARAFTDDKLSIGDALSSLFGDTIPEAGRAALMAMFTGPILSAFGGDFDFAARGKEFIADMKVHSDAQSAAAKLMDLEQYRQMSPQEIAAALEAIKKDMKVNAEAYEALAVMLDASQLVVDRVGNGALQESADTAFAEQWTAAQKALADAQNDQAKALEEHQKLAAQEADALEKKKANPTDKATVDEHNRLISVVADSKKRLQQLNEAVEKARTDYDALDQARQDREKQKLDALRQEAIQEAREAHHDKVQKAIEAANAKKNAQFQRVGSTLAEWKAQNSQIARDASQLEQAKLREQRAQEELNTALQNQTPAQQSSTQQSSTTEQMQTQLDAEEQRLAELLNALDQARQNGDEDVYNEAYASLVPTIDQQQQRVERLRSAMEQTAQSGVVEAAPAQTTSAAPEATGQPVATEAAPQTTTPQAQPGATPETDADMASLEASMPPEAETGAAPSTRAPKTSVENGNKATRPRRAKDAEIAARQAGLASARSDVQQLQGRVNAQAALREQVMATAASGDTRAAANLISAALTTQPAPGQQPLISLQDAMNLANEARLPLADIGGRGIPGVYYQGTGARPTLDAEKQTQIKMLGAFAKTFGLEVILRDQLAEGQYNGALINGTNRIYLSLNTISNGILHYGTHEMTHFISQNNHAGYLKIRNAVTEYLTGRGVDIEAAIRDKAENEHYMPEGVENKEQWISEHYTMLEEEVIADSLSQMFADKGVLEKFANDHPELVHGPIRRWFLDFWRRLADAIRSIGGDVTNREYVTALIGDSQALMNLYDLFTENGKIAGDEYRKHAPAVETAGQSDATLSISTLDAWEKSLRLELTRLGASLDEIEEAVKTVREQAKELLDLANQGEEGRRMLAYVYRGPDVAKSIRGGNMAPIRQNQEYVWTFDLDTNCPKRLRYSHIVSYVESQLHRLLTSEECKNLMTIMAAVDEETPCTYCYVEGHRAAMNLGYDTYLTRRYNALSTITENTTEEDVLAAIKKEFPTVSAATLKGLAQVSSQYNPTQVELHDTIAGIQRSIYDYLDGKYLTDSRYAQEKNGTYKFSFPNRSLNNLVREVGRELGLSPTDLFRKANENSKSASITAVGAEIKQMVSAWLFDAYSKANHVYLGDESVVMTPDTNINAALTLHHFASNYAKSFSQARNMDNYVPYSGQARQVTLEEKEVMNAHGGFRIHSSNDFRPDYVIDYFQFFTDLAADQRNSKGGDTPEGWFVHCYTKAADFVKIFAPTGARINMSIAMNGDDATGITPNFKEGMDWNEAMALRHDYQNAGVMAMVTNDDQLSFALNSPWIDMCIPFHASGIPVKYYSLKAWFDYTALQNEMWPSATLEAELRERYPDFGSKGEIYVVSGKENKAYVKEHGKLPMTVDDKGNEKPAPLSRYKPHFLPGSVTIYAFTKDGTYLGPMEIEGHGNDKETYLRLCREWGVLPRFYGHMVKDAQGNAIRIEDHPNYMKVIYETARVDTPQQYVTANFDTSRVIDSLRGFVSKQERDLDVTQNVESTRGPAAEDAGMPSAADLFLRLAAGKKTFLATPEQYEVLRQRAERGDKGIDLSNYEVMPEELLNAQRTIYENRLNQRTQAARDMGAYMTDYNEQLDQMTQYRAEEAAEGRYYGAQGGTSYYSGNESTQGATLSRVVGYNQLGKSFAEQVDDYITDPKSMPKDENLFVRESPEVLLGIGATALPMITSRGHLRQWLSGNAAHRFTEAQIKSIPQQLADPIAIIASRSENAQNSLVELIELDPVKPGTGKRELAAVKIDGTGKLNGERYDAHVVTTVHRRPQALNLLIDALQKEQTGEIAVYYLDKKRASTLLQGSGLQLPSSLQSGGSIHSITDPGSPVKPRISSQTKTSQFQRFIKDSKLAKQISAQEWEPRTVYHYTNAESIEVFDTTRSGSNQGARLGDGIYISTSPTAFAHAGKNRMELYAAIRTPFEVKNGLTEDEAKYVLEKYGATKHDLDAHDGLYREHAMPKLQSPLRVFDYLREYARDNDTTTSAILEDLGYDGVHDGIEWVAFHSNQLKSATDNIGTFNPNDPRVTYSRNRLQSPERIFQQLYDGIGVQLTVDRAGFGSNDADARSYSNMRTGATHVRSSAVQDADAYIHELAQHLDARTAMTLDNFVSGPELEKIAQNNTDPVAYGQMTKTQRRKFGLEELLGQYLRYGEGATRAANGGTITDTLVRELDGLKWLRPMRIAQRQYTALLNSSAAQQAMARIDYDDKKRASHNRGHMMELVQFNLGDHTYPMLRLTNLMKAQFGDDYQRSLDPRELMLLNPNMGANFSKTVLEDRLVNYRGETLDERSLQGIIARVPSGQRDDFLNYWTLLDSRERDKQNKTVYGTDPVTVATRDKAIAEYEQAHKDWAKIVNEACEWKNKFIQAWVVDTGGMTQERFDEMKKLYPHHIPTYRADYFFKRQKYDGAGTGDGKSHTSPETVGNGMQNATGSTRDLIDPALGLAHYVQGVVSAMKTREAYAAFADAIRLTADNADIAELVQTPEMDTHRRTNSDPVTPENPLEELDNRGVMDTITRHGDGLFTVRDLNGQLVTVQIHQPLIAAALLNSDPQEMSPLMRKFGKLKKLITLTATAKSIRFSGQNVFGDWFVSWVTGSYASGPDTAAVKWLLGAGGLLYNKIRDALGKDTSDTYKAYNLFGHMESRYSLSNPSGRKEARAAVLGEGRFARAAETFKGTAGAKGNPVMGILQFIREGTIGTIGRGIEAVTDFSENSTRYTEFRFGHNQSERSLRQLLKPWHQRSLATYDERIEGGRAAQEVTTNFQKHGNSKLLKDIGMGVPFMGASIQGTNKALMTFSSQNQGHRLATAAKLTEVAFLAILYAAWQHLGWSDEDKELYDEYQDDYKMKYYFIPVGNGKFLRVKKAQDSMFQLADGIGTLIGRYHTGIGDDFAGDLLSLAENLLGEATGFTTVLDPILAVGRNLTWYGSQLESYHDQQRSEQDRYDEDTSIVWKSVSTALHARGVEWSPKDVEYVVRQYLGSYGTILGKSLDQATEGKLTAASLGQIIWDRVVSGYVVDGLDGSRATQVFYDLSDQIDQFLTTAGDEDDSFYIRASYGTAEYDEAVDEAKRIQEMLKGVKKEIKALWVEYREAAEAGDEEVRREVKYEILRVSMEANAEMAAFWDEYGYASRYQRSFYNQLKLFGIQDGSED